MADDSQKLDEYIYVVDDSPEMVDLICQDPEGIECPMERFTLPREAIHRCQTKRPFLVISVDFQRGRHHVTA